MESWVVMVLGGSEAEHDQLPVPAYVTTAVPLARKRALARLRLSSAPIQTNTQLSVCYTQRWCTRGCTAATDSEQHLLFECPAFEDVRALFSDALNLADCDLSGLMDGVYCPELVGSIMDFTYGITYASPGPSA
jgi:hypothetical protein